MKLITRKRWIRLIQFLAAIVSLVILFVVSINWWGAKMKRDAILELRAQGRPVSLNEFLTPLPPEDENIAMTPVLKKAREEWWASQSKSKTPVGGACQLLGDLMPLAVRGGTSNQKKFIEDRPQALRYWKEKLQLTGSPSDCLLEYDRRNVEVLASLREGLERPSIASPTLYWLSEKQTYSDINGLFIIRLRDAAEGLNFRAELAVEADLPSVAHESLLMAIQLARTARAEPFLINQMVSSAILRILKPSLAYALENRRWTNEQMMEVQRQLQILKGREAFLQSLDFETLTSFSMIGKEKTNGGLWTLSSWDADAGTSAWRQRMLAPVVPLLPKGWFDANAAMRARSDLAFRNELNVDEKLMTWEQASRTQRAKDDSRPSWAYWIYPLAKVPYTEIVQNSCPGQVLIQQAILACDLEIHRNLHGSYPQALEEVQSPSIIDPMTGEPFKYRTTENSCVLYSIGSDNKDDGGIRGPKRNPDWIW